MAASVRDKTGITVSLCELCGSLDNLKLCGRCKTSWYCSRDHQKSDWKRHKKLCQTQTNNYVVNSFANEHGSSTTSTAYSSTSEGMNQAQPVIAESRQACRERNVSDVASPQNKLTLKGSSVQPLPHVDKFDPGGHNLSTVQQSTTPGERTVLCDDVNVAEEGSIDETENKYSESSENYIRQSEISELTEPSYHSDAGVTRKPDMPELDTREIAAAKTKQTYLTILESRNKATSEYVIKCLNSYGVCVLDNFLGESKGTDILNEVKSLHEHGKLMSGQVVNAANNSETAAIRGDIITWIEGSEAGCENINFLISAVDAIILQCQRRLGGYNINGRSKAMVACYPGQSSGFLRHVDNPSGDGRCVTCLYYLNKGWSSRENGGLLRIFPEGESRVANVEPIFDRLLFFWSDRRNPHEVMPAMKTRYAITVWYYDAEERKRAVKRFKGAKYDPKRDVLPLTGAWRKNNCKKVV